MSKAKYWFDKAKSEHFALGAFNAASIETLKAIVTAAKNLQSPVIIESSPREVEYFGLTELVGVVRALEQNYEIPIILNLDHARDLPGCQKAIEAGFDYVHFDGSNLPLEENVAVAKQVVALAHAKDILVEGEMDKIEGSSADHRHDVDGYKKQMSDFTAHTDPVKAKEFVENTGIDTFASFVGNVHGLYPGPKRINIDLLKQIHESLPAIFLSLHGGSGIPDDDIRSAIENGVVKINVNSELRVAFRDKLKEILMGEEGEEVAIYNLMPDAIAAMRAIVESKIKLFGSAGKL